MYYYFVTQWSGDPDVASDDARGRSTRPVCVLRSTTTPLVDLDRHAICSMCSMWSAHSLEDWENRGVRRNLRAGRERFAKIRRRS